MNDKQRAWVEQKIEEAKMCLAAAEARLLTVCAEEPPPTHNGYTMEQWEQISELPVPIVCEFWDDSDIVHEPSIGVLAKVFIEFRCNGGRPFQNLGRKGEYLIYQNCRVITKPGYWIPHFQAPAPVGLDVKAILLLDDGRYLENTKAVRMSWEERVIAYMIMP